MSDQQALDAFGFDIRLRYALDVDDQDAYLSWRSLVEFRGRLAIKDPDMETVRTIFEGPVDHRMRSSNNRKGSSLHTIFNGDTCRGCSKLYQCPVRAPNNRQRGCNVRHTKGDFRLEITTQLRFDPDRAHRSNFQRSLLKLEPKPLLCLKVSGEE